MLNAVVIDDEQFAREELCQLLIESGQVEVLGEAPNAIIGLQKINELKPDVVFLDIQMPQVSGIELLSMLDPDTMPRVVFVTAFDDYAIQAFEDNAFDYLLKPLDPKRLNKTLCRLKKEAHQHEPSDVQIIAPDRLEQIPCVGLNRIVMLATEQVECAFTDISGVHIQTAAQTASTQLTLKVLEEKTSLIRCHRQYLVNSKTIREIKLLENGLAEIITRSGFDVPVSRRYFKLLKELLGISG
ncbi:two-component system response regulator BtsR [Vibrio maerlii]|uniref:two-component system response regulator BtsR n=1 Tax=Vibrio maerlii TaxID=2231648 RepID=UPI000E3E6CBB|nr:two-component system response regulator BtsR [Vibrio maerlii]